MRGGNYTPLTASIMLLFMDNMSDVKPDAAVIRVKNWR